MYSGQLFLLCLLSLKHLTKWLWPIIRTTWKVNQENRKKVLMSTEYLASFRRDFSPCLPSKSKWAVLLTFLPGINLFGNQLLDKWLCMWRQMILSSSSLNLAWFWVSSPAFPEYLAGKEIISVAVDFLQDDLDERGRERSYRLSVMLTQYDILDHHFLKCRKYPMLQKKPILYFTAWKYNLFNSCYHGIWALSWK